MFDTLVFNGKIYTMERESEIFSAMAIKNSKIVKLYEKNPENPEKIAKQIIDINNKAVLPGLIDCHVHFITTAISKEIGIPISEMVDGKLEPSTLDGIRKKSQEYAKTLSPKQPLLFGGIILPSIKEGHLPFREQIDEWFPGRDVIFMTIDGHAFSLSTRSLISLGIDPEGHNGVLTEDMKEFDMDKIMNLVKRGLNFGTILSGLKQTINEAIKFGIVGIHCIDGFQKDAKSDITLRFMQLFGGKIPLYLREYPQVRDVSQISFISKKMRTPRVGGCGAWELDGAVGARTAAFYEPYLGEPYNTGAILYPHEELLRDSRKAYKKGFQITSHAIGTRAIDQLLDVFEQVLTENNDLENKQRLRIDHFEFPTKDAIKRAIGKLNLLVVPQPGFNWINTNFPGMQTYEKYLKPEIVALQNPLKTIVDMGGKICGSTDSPIQSLDPFLQIHGMVNFPVESERISVYQAFRTYTYNGAYATFEEDRRGTLSLGKFADFIVFDENPFEISPDQLINLKVNATYIQGKIVSKIKMGRWAFFLKLLSRKGEKFNL